MTENKRKQILDMHECEKNLPARTEFLLYKTEDGRVRIQTRLEDETVWLSINQMADLFDIDKSGISRHLKNIFDTGELARDSVVAIFATTASDGKTYQVEHYNLDRIVSLYLDYAELQAVQQNAMTMSDWIEKLDDFLKLSGRDILTHAGKISHDAAMLKAHAEYEEFNQSQIEKPTDVEKHFVEAEKEAKRIEASKKKGR